MLRMLIIAKKAQVNLRFRSVPVRVLVMVTSNATMTVPTGFALSY